VVVVSRDDIMLQVVAGRANSSVCRVDCVFLKATCVTVTMTVVTTQMKSTVDMVNIVSLTDTGQSLACYKLYKRFYGQFCIVYFANEVYHHREGYNVI